ncbi:MAG: hypothetical protein HC945_02435 [Nitrosarchaeum sp.]|nr:hypothetical protein [Nitrosarchaeum sp.]
MMGFDEEKQVALERMRSFDRSDIGRVDPPVQELVDKINSLDRFYTTSSCSGRIIVLRTLPGGRKKDAQFLYRSHEPAESAAVLAALQACVGEGSATLRMQAAILHVCARDIPAALELIALLRPIGFKRCGIFSVQDERVMVEAIGPESPRHPPCSGRRAVGIRRVRPCVHRHLQYLPGAQSWARTCGRGCDQGARALRGFLRPRPGWSGHGQSCPERLPCASLAASVRRGRPFRYLPWPACA